MKLLAFTREEYHPCHPLEAISGLIPEGEGSTRIFLDDTWGRNCSSLQYNPRKKAPRGSNFYSGVSCRESRRPERTSAVYSFDREELETAVNTRETRVLDFSVLTGQSPTMAFKPPSHPLVPSYSPRGPGNRKARSPADKATPLEAGAHGVQDNIVR